MLIKGIEGLQIVMDAAGVGMLKYAMSSFDAATAQATQPADRDRILADIAASIGMAEFNKQVRLSIGETVSHAPFHMVHSVPGIRWTPLVFIIDNR